MKSLLTSLLVLAIVLGIYCAWSSAADRSGTGKMTEKKVIEVLREHTDELMSLPGIAGIAEGLCHGSPCIKVLVIKKTPELEEKIPSMLEGYPVMIEETGKIHAG
jgi:hypothetical protein